jgi:hypothetical protein
VPDDHDDFPETEIPRIFQAIFDEGLAPETHHAFIFFLGVFVEPFAPAPGQDQGLQALIIWCGRTFHFLLSIE